MKTHDVTLHHNIYQVNVNNFNSAQSDGQKPRRFKPESFDVQQQTVAIDGCPIRHKL